MINQKQSNILIFLFPLLFLSSVTARELKSGYEYLSATSQEIQDDDFANQGMTAVEEGRVEFHKAGVNDKTCATCHGENGSKFNLKKLPAIPYTTKNIKSLLLYRNKLIFVEKNIWTMCLMFMIV